MIYSSKPTLAQREKLEKMHRDIVGLIQQLSHPEREILMLVLLEEILHRHLLTLKDPHDRHALRTYSQYQFQKILKQTFGYDANNAGYVELNEEEMRTNLIALEIFKGAQQFLAKDIMENNGIDADKKEIETKAEISSIMQKIYLAARIKGYNIGELVRFGLKEIEK